MNDCPFCKIVEGRIPASKIAESASFVAFLDIKPAANGHVLIIPKKHSTNLLDLPTHSGTELVEFAQRTAQALMHATGAAGFNFVLNNGEEAGQSVFHTHFHIIPRTQGDDLSTIFAHSKEAAPSDLAALQEKIKQHL
jgi:histidine triad (HIT) family protein